MKFLVRWFFLFEEDVLQFEKVGFQFEEVAVWFEEVVAIYAVEGGGRVEASRARGIDVQLKRGRRIIKRVIILRLG